MNASDRRRPAAVDDESVLAADLQRYHDKYDAALLRLESLLDDVDAGFGDQPGAIRNHASSHFLYAAKHGAWSARNKMTLTPPDPDTTPYMASRSPVADGHVPTDITNAKGTFTSIVKYHGKHPKAEAAADAIVVIEDDLANKGFMEDHAALQPRLAAFLDARARQDHQALLNARDAQMEGDWAEAMRAARQRRRERHGGM